MADGRPAAKGGAGMVSGEAPTTLEATARWTAAVRAMETARTDRLVDDPWAAELAGEDGRAWLQARTPDSVLPILLRTRYYDDWLQGIVGADSLRQVVLLGAGLDTRAFRLAWPDDTLIFELDHAPVLRHKDDVLEAAGASPRCDRRTVEADLLGGWDEALADAGFQADLPTAWLLEGLLFYIPSADVARILDDVTRLSAPGSRLGFDIVNAAVLTSQWTRPWVDMQAAAGAPWLGTMEDPVGFLAERGWTASLTQAGQPDANHGRWTLPVIPTTMPGMPHSWLVTAVRPG
jgi:methyltransferase (TIGR00027 family)